MAKAHHSITKPPPCFAVIELQGVAALSPTHTLLFGPKISNFDSSVLRTLFYCSIVQSLRALGHWSLLTLFCFLNSNSAIQASFTVYVDTRFHCIGSVVQWYLEQSAFCQTNWWLMELSSALVAFSLLALLFVLPFSFPNLSKQYKQL